MTPVDLLRSRTRQLELVDEARAPSVHNTQAARWQFSDKKIRLLADPNARLLVADPDGRDHFASLGCAFEAMQLALSRRSLALVKIQMGEGVIGGHQFIADAELAERLADPDPLSDLLARRRTFRGRMVKPTDEQLAELQKKLSTSERAIVVTDAKRVRHFHQLADELNSIWMCRREYAEELYSWLRLSEDHPRWNIDGLNADVLSLNAIERLIAQQAMRPRVYAQLDRARLGGLVLAEAYKHRPALLLLVTRPKSESPFESGRQFLRLWLTITKAGFVACPMSILADAKFAKEELTREFQIKPDYELMNVLRIGIAASDVPISARYPADEIVLK